MIHQKIVAVHIYLIIILGYHKNTQEMSYVSDFRNLSCEIAS